MGGLCTPPLQDSYGQWGRTQGRARSSSSGNKSFELQEENQDNRKRERILHFVHQRSEYLRHQVLRGLRWLLFYELVYIVTVSEPSLPYRLVGWAFYIITTSALTPRLDLCSWKSRLAYLEAIALKTPKFFRNLDFGQRVAFSDRAWMGRACSRPWVWPQQQQQQQQQPPII